MDSERCQKLRNDRKCPNCTDVKFQQQTEVDRTCCMRGPTFPYPKTGSVTRDCKRTAMVAIPQILSQGHLSNNCLFNHGQTHPVHDPCSPGLLFMNNLHNPLFLPSIAPLASPSLTTCLLPAQCPLLPPFIVFWRTSHSKWLSVDSSKQL